MRTRRDETCMHRKSNEGACWFTKAMKRHANALASVVTGWVIVVAVAQMSAQQDKQPNAASPDKGKFGPTLLRIGTQYSIFFQDDGNNLWMDPCGFVNLKDKVVIEPQWEDARDFHEGYAAVQQKGKWGWLDKTGLHIDPQLSEPVEFHGGCTATNPGKTALIQIRAESAPCRSSRKSWHPSCAKKNGASSISRSDRSYDYVTAMLKWMDSTGKEIGCKDYHKAKALLVILPNELSLGRSGKAGSSCAD